MNEIQIAVKIGNTDFKHNFFLEDILSINARVESLHIVHIRFKHGGVDEIRIDEETYNRLIKTWIENKKKSNA